MIQMTQFAKDFDDRDEGEREALHLTLNGKQNTYLIMSIISTSLMAFGIHRIMISTNDYFIANTLTAHGWNDVTQTEPK